MLRELAAHQSIPANISCSKSEIEILGKGVIDKIVVGSSALHYLQSFV